MEITPRLMNWYRQNHRDLPWRNTQDPYKIWLSEVILQQTRINQGMDYYLKFVENYPEVNKLAKAPEDEVLKLWQGLGYYSRARNLHKAAKAIMQQFNGEFPSSYEEILKLPGIGHYTASAISSIAFHQPHPAIDGNVLRVISRLFAIDEPVNSGAGLKKVREILHSLIDKNNPGIFNQAVMEFGAMYCKPQNPDCQNCIFVSECLAFLQKKVDSLPVKTKKPLQKVRFFNYLIINQMKENNSFVYLHKRSKSDIWKGLYDFPLIETPKELTHEEIVSDPQWINLFSNVKPVIKKVSGKFTHILTHQKIIARFIETEIDTPITKGNFIEVRLDSLEKYPVPILIEKYLQDVSLH